MGAPKRTGRHRLRPDRSVQKQKWLSLGIVGAVARRCRDCAVSRHLILGPDRGLPSQPEIQAAVWMVLVLYWVNACADRAYGISQGRAC